MTEHPETEIAPGPGASAYNFDAREFPWWLVGMLGLIGLMAAAVVFSDAYREAFEAIVPLPANLPKGWH